MAVKVYGKVYAGLLPGRPSPWEFEQDLPDGAVVADLLDRLGVQERIYLVVLVNGMRAGLSRPLSEGDRLEIMKPVGGG